MKSLVADKSAASLMGVEREEDATALFPLFSKITMGKNLADAGWSFDSEPKEKHR